jgi:7-cyano-7-deazaguanine synthase
VTTIQNKETCMVLFSGGQDSTTCLLQALEQYKNVVAVSVNYGQRHVEELICAKSIAESLGAEHHILDMSLLGQLAPNALTRTDLEVDTQTTEGALPNTFVDGRNLLFLSFVAVMAKQRGITKIITGVSQSDFSGYPDCRDIFIKSLNVTLNLSMDYDFVIETPLMWLDKAQTWELADSMGRLEFVREKTLTCYNGVIGDGCGNCPACDLRSKGLNQYLAKKSL